MTVTTDWTLTVHNDFCSAVLVILFACWFDHWLSLWFDDLFFALAWPSRLTGRSLSILPQWGISQLVHLWFDDLSFAMMWPSRLVLRTFLVQLFKKKSYWIKHRRTSKVLSALSRASLYRDEARRGVSVATAPEGRKAWPSPTHDNRHSPLSGALDVSGAAL